MASVMLSTIDNPYSPFDHFDEWYAYDMLLAAQEGRNTCCGYLAAVSAFSDDISDKEYEDLLEETIDDICELNLNGKFIKVTENAAESPKTEEKAAEEAQEPANTG